MLSEEGLILLGVFVACALVALGVLELVWPTRPRHPERRRRPAPDLWRQVAAATVLAQRRASSGAEPGVAGPAMVRVPVPPTIPVAVLSDPVRPPVAQPPADGATQPPADGATQPPADGATQPPADGATKSPADGAAKAPPVDDFAMAPAVGTTAPAGGAVPPVPEIEEPAAVVVPEVVAPATAEAVTETDDDLLPTSPPALRIVPPSHGERPDARRDRPRAPRPRPLPRSATRSVPPEPPAEAPAKAAAPAGAAGAPEPSTQEVPVIDRCRALLESERFREAVTLGEEALTARKAAAASVTGATAAQEAAQLWGTVGLAKQGLEDFEGARFAFEEAIAVAPRTERLTWERSLASLALTVGRQSLVGAQADPARPAHVDSLRSAIDWLERGLVVAPDDTGLRDALAATREALWPTYEAVVKALVQRQEFDEARRMLDEVLADPECPAERHESLRRLLDGARGTEAGQATAEALRLLQRGRDDDAAAALARAETMLAALGPDALGAPRRQELERRLWSAYLKLGSDRVEAGARETAMSPLFRALALTELGTERQDVVRALLVRALTELVDERSAAIGRLIDAGDMSTASSESDKLWTLLRGAVDQGLPEDDVLDIFNKVLALFRRMSGKRA